MSDSQALSLFLTFPVTQDMLQYVVTTTLKVLPCPSSKSSKYSKSSKSSIQIPPSSPSHSSEPSTPYLPSLMSFLSTIIRCTNAYTGTLMATLIYLERLKQKLPSGSSAQDASARHRILLAALILSAKYNNDSSPKNKHWAKYTNGLFTTYEVNEMERQYLYLLDWDVRFETEELIHHLRPFLEPIKADIRRTIKIRKIIKQQKVKQQQQQQQQKQQQTNAKKEKELRIKQEQKRQQQLKEEISFLINGEETPSTNINTSTINSLHTVYSDNDTSFNSDDNDTSISSISSSGSNNCTKKHTIKKAERILFPPFNPVKSLRSSSSNSSLRSSNLSKGSSTTSASSNLSLTSDFGYSSDLRSRSGSDFSLSSASSLSLSSYSLKNNQTKNPQCLSPILTINSSKNNSNEFVPKILNFENPLDLTNINTNINIEKHRNLLKPSKSSINLHKILKNDIEYSNNLNSNFSNSVESQHSDSLKENYKINYYKTFSNNFHSVNYINGFQNISRSIY
ncbi:cyclin family protein ASCRUDRAFT_76490 [Ascoidea rubescens DSM 1968]|uniref:Cyclin N-terminal domain-containing protein n=1 Tax=Ascoidea rubescens DSM 1968 TaxID=1344418 RepID=A0A1D2VFT6_9ASCO|nr:hypothetical protein ASCRUDRAFT_76490 [Ascoidea rubescens DSM 1968]ODV60521.1 hypothetical protein ASCRUDRAFT_76490 [Ascoidea rubescens DSM 1968]